MALPRLKNISPIYNITTPEIISENKKITADNPTVTVRVKATKLLHGINVPVNVINKTTSQIALAGDDGYAIFTITAGGKGLICRKI